MILYAWTGGQSVLASFLATVIPGIILTALLSFLNCYLLRNDKNIVVTSAQTVSATDVIVPRKKFSLFRTKYGEAFPALFMPVIVLGGIYSGIMTPTEAAGVSVMYALPVGMFIYKGLTMKRPQRDRHRSGNRYGRHHGHAVRLQRFEQNIHYGRRPPYHP